MAAHIVPTPVLPPLPAVGRHTVLLVGDSITERGGEVLPEEGTGWALQLASTYARRADVLNRGYSGYTTRFVRAMLPAVIPPPEAAPRHLFATIFLGANDSAGWDEAVERAPAQHVPLPEFRDNLAALIAAAAGAAAAVFVLSPPPVDTARWSSRSNAAVTAYTAAVAEVVRAAAAGSGVVPVTHIDLYAGMTAAVAAAGTVEAGAPPGWHAYLSDGLHLSPAGNTFVLRALQAAIAGAAPWAVPDALTIDFPRWDDVPNESAAVAAAALSPAALAELRAVPRPRFRAAVAAVAEAVVAE